jgi:hypothetical protein
MAILPTGDASISNALSAHIEQDHLTVELVTLACGGGCADVVAVAKGGFPPYSFAWEDGSTDPSRRVCPTSTTHYRVSVTDAGETSGELTQAPETADAELTADVVVCPVDAGSPAPAPPADAGTCGIDEVLRPDIFDHPAYFAGGAALPAGNYRLQYVDGCMKYDATWLWTVNASFNDEFVVIGDSTADVLGVAPGTRALFGFGFGGGYTTFDACVAANRALPPLDLTFAGGKLGLYQNDFQPPDNIAGPNGDSPSWRLTRLPPCR